MKEKKEQVEFKFDWSLNYVVLDYYL